MTRPCSPDCIPCNTPMPEPAPQTVEDAARLNEAYRQRRAVWGEGHPIVSHTGETA